MENLNDITIFVRVVEKKSFSGAARDLDLSVSYVSKRVSFLEEALETQLLKRSTRFLALTESGEIFYERCAEAIRLLDSARSEALEHAEHLRGTLRVFVAMGFGEYVLWRLVAEFTKQFPEINVELRIGLRATNVLETGSDIVIRSADLPDSSLERRDLGVLHYHICASPSFLQLHGAPESPADLKNFNCLVHTAHHPADRWIFEIDGKTTTIDVSGSLRSNSGVVIHGACVEGLGIARLPHYIADLGVQNGYLKELFPGAHRFERALKAFYPRSKHLPAKVTTFLDFLETRLARNPDVGSSEPAAIMNAYTSL